MERDDFTDPPAGDPDDRESVRLRAGDLFRRVLVTGAGALFMTEEGIRSLVREAKLPKEVIGSVLAQADRTKAEIARVVGSEVRNFLESTRMREEMVRMLTQLRLEVRAEIGFKTADDQSSVFEPAVKSKVTVKKTGAAAAKKKPAAPRKKATPAKKKSGS